MEWLPQLITPMVIISVIVYMGNLTNKRINGLDSSLNKRIDDLRFQMSREHDILSKKVDLIDVRDKEKLNYPI